MWTFAKALAHALATKHPKLLTAIYRIADRPAGRVLVDYNQNAWGRTLASVYSPRPRPRASVSTPLTWQEVEHGVKIEDCPPAPIGNTSRNGTAFAASPSGTGSKNLPIRYR